MGRLSAFTATLAISPAMKRLPAIVVAFVERHSRERTPHFNFFKDALWRSMRVQVLMPLSSRILRRIVTVMRLTNSRRTHRATVMLSRLSRLVTDFLSHQEQSNVFACRY